MKHIIHKENPNNKYKIAVLVEESRLDKKEIEDAYVHPLVKLGIAEEDIISFSLNYNDKGNAPIGFCKEYLSTLLPALDSLDVKTLVVANGNYFKALTKVRKTEPYYGSAVLCTIKDFNHLNIFLIPNYKALFYNPVLQEKIDITNKAVADHTVGSYKEIGIDIIHSQSYPKDFLDIRAALAKLHEFEALTCDCETFSLKFHKAGLGTIGFGIDQHNGLAFLCDYEAFPTGREMCDSGVVLFGYKEHNPQIKRLLKEFFKSYKGKLIYHNANYDIKILVYELFMDSLLDIKGMLRGIEILTRDFECTKAISYLATNTTAGNKLGLKDQAFEYAGNYAVDDIKNIRKIPKDTLLKYNLIDCLSTWYVFNKNYPIMVKDSQLEIYETIMKPSIKTILQMELTGMPIDMDQVIIAKSELSNVLYKHTSSISASPIISTFEDVLRKDAWAKKNLLLKVKQVAIEEFDMITFNPASNKQVAQLLHEHLGLEILDTTKTDLPAVGAKVLTKHLNQLIQEYSLTEEELNG
jgi:DNA polymerase-1